MCQFESGELHKERVRTIGIKVVRYLPPSAADFKKELFGKVDASLSDGMDSLPLKR